MCIKEEIKNKIYQMNDEFSVGCEIHKMNCAKICLMLNNLYKIKNHIIIKVYISQINVNIYFLIVPCY